MQQAICLKTQTRLSADTAAPRVLAKELGKHEFECYGCPTPLMLASYKKSNLKRPYFRLPSQTVHHLANCSVVSSDGGEGGSKSDGSRPRPIINALVLEPKSDKRYGPVRQDGREDGQAPKEHSRRSRPKAAATTADALRAVVEEYARNHALRNHPLDVPGVKAKTYAGCFQPLAGKYDRRSKAFSRPKLAGRFIYFGELRFKSELEEDDSLIATDFIQEAPDGNYYRLEIGTEEWSGFDRQQLVNELERAGVLTEKGWRESKAHRKKKSKGVFVFLFAELVEGTNLIRVEDPRLVCTISREDEPGIVGLPSSNLARLPEPQPPKPSNPTPLPKQQHRPQPKSVGDRSQRTSQTAAVVSDGVPGRPAGPQGASSKSTKKGFWARLAARLGIW